MVPHSNEAILLLENLDHMTLLCYLLALITIGTHFFNLYVFLPVFARLHGSQRQTLYSLLYPMTLNNAWHIVKIQQTLAESSTAQLLNI